jgi:hypothetical protein
MPRSFGSFFQILGFEFKTRRLRDTCHHRLVFETYLEDKEDSRFKLDPQRDSSIQPKTRWATPYRVWFSSHPIQKIIFEDLKLLGAWAPKPRNNQESTGKTSPRWSFRRTRGWLRKYSEAYSTRLQRAQGLVRPRTIGLPLCYRIF